MKTPLTVFTTIPPNSSASFYYRLTVPLRTADDLGLNVVSQIDTQDAMMPEINRIQAFCESDVVLMYQPTGEQNIQRIRSTQGFLPSKREGVWKWPPTMILETDDNLFNVSPFNSAFKGLGIRDMDGNDIPIGHHIGIVAGGERKVLWKDGENGFSIAENRERVNSYRKLLSMVDLVSCSTDGVKAAVDKEVVTRRTKVFPNLVRFQDYEQVDLAEDPKTIKILWQGGAAHFEDWQPLREAMGNLTRKYPEVHWIIWGAQWASINDQIPAHRYTYKDWCAYNEYKLRLAMIGHDIALAPLQDHLFNTCRSAIKFYEASVLKKPVATLAQNSAAYKREIKDGETGLLFNNPKEFEEKLSLLIEDTKLRRTLGENAKDWVHENRDAMKEVPKMVSYWEQLREERKKEQPHPTDSEWDKIFAEAEKEAKEEVKEPQEVA